MFLRTCVAQALRRGVGPCHSLPRFGTTASLMKRVQRRFDLIKKKTLPALATAETLRKLLLNYQLLHSGINEKKQNTSEKLDYRYCCISHPTHRKKRFLKVKLESWTEQKKHDSDFDQLRMKKSRFVSKLRKVLFFLQLSMGGLTPGPFP